MVNPPPIVIGIPAPPGPMPLPTFPPIPTQWVGITPPGCIEGRPGCIGFLNPNPAGIPGWLFHVALAFVEWVFFLIIWGLDWLIYAMAVMLLEGVSALLNGILALVYVYWNAAAAVGTVAGPLGPIVAAIALSGFVLTTVLAFLWLIGVAARGVGSIVTKVQSSEPSGSSGSSGGNDAEMEEVAELAA